MRAFWTVLFVGLLCMPLGSAHPEPRGDAVAAPIDDSLAAIQATLRLPAATHFNDADGDKVFDSLEAQYLLAGLTTLPTIVTFVHGADTTAALAAASRVAGGLEPRYVYHAYGGFAADLRLDQALAIAALPVVRQVEWSQPGALELDTATRNLNVDAVQAIGVTGDRDGLPTSGNDTLIAILDTGFDGKHVDLAGKFVRFIDWRDGGAEKEPYDSGNHGTHVASIAAGLGAADKRYVGVAPGAGIVGFLISSSDTKGAAIASIDYLLERRDELPVDVLTISFGFGFTVDGTDALELAMDKAWEAGITNFKSTGNSGPGRSTVTVPGGARGIMGTASIFEPGEGGFRLSSFSSRGPTADGRLKPDIAAPGSNIEAAGAGTGNGYITMSGTSMASPFAAGVAALVKSVDPSLQPDDVRRILTSTAHDWGTPGHDIEYGNGRIDALRAVQLAALERTVRDGLGADWLRPFNITGEVVPGHQHGVLSGQGASATFEVIDPAQPLAVTFIANHSASVATASIDAFVAVVRDPDGLLVATVSPGGVGDVPTYSLGTQPNPSRQQTVAVQPTKTGTYTIDVIAGGHDEILWDVSAGLPENEIEDLLSAFLGKASEVTPSAGDEKQSPGPAPLVALALLLALARRRQR